MKARMQNASDIMANLSYRTTRLLKSPIQANVRSTYHRSLYPSSHPLC